MGRAATPEGRRGYPSYRSEVRGDPQRPAPRFATARGFRFSYDDVGDGPPVVLIHGTTRSGGDWWELGYVGRLLELGRRVLVVDPLGHGQSDAPGDPSDYRYPDVALDIAAVMTAVGIERAAIWGYSRGAALGASLAIEAPERVERLVIGGQGALEQAPPPTLEPFHRGMLAGDWGAFWATPMAVAWNTDADHPYAEANFDVRAFGAAWAGLRLFPYTFRLDAIRCPVLLYQGGDDDPDEATATASLLRVEALIIPGRDHNSAMWDIDAVWPAVEPFLSLPPPPAYLGSSA